MVDIGLFNVLRFAGGEGVLYDRPLTAKVISVSAATLVAWLGNRYWTFRHRRRAAAAHELLLFVVFNVAGMVIALACLGLSHYVLDLRSPLADNVSANGVGLILGTLFRFWAYRRFVFSKDELLEDTSPLAHPELSRWRTTAAEPRGIPVCGPALGGVRPRRTPRGTARRSPAGPG